MPAKGTKVKNTKSANSVATKSNIAKASSKTGLLSRKVKFNWKIAAVIGVVLVIALGYLFVRLSQAGSLSISASNMYATNGAAPATKANGQAIIQGPGFAEKIINPKINREIYPAFGSGVATYTVQFFNSSNKTGSGGIYIDCLDGRRILSRPSNQITSGQSISVTLGYNGIASACGQSGHPIKILIGIPAEYWITGISVQQPSSGGPVSSPSPAPGTKQPAPPTQGLCEGQNVFGPGSQGNCVRIIQQRLTDLGYNPGVVDGIYGQNTANAVRGFQQRNGLAQDGVVGPQTWTALTNPNAARKQ